MRAQKEELRKRIEQYSQLKEDFDFLIEKAGLQPHRLVTGLWLDYNLMKADPVGPALDFLEQIGTGWSFRAEVNA